MNTATNILSVPPADPASQYAAMTGRGAGSGTTPANGAGTANPAAHATTNATANATENGSQSSNGKPGASSKQLQSMAAEANQALSGITSLQIQVDQNINAVVVKVVDTSNNQVIRQIPSEQMVDLLKRMKDLQGLLCDTKA